MADEVRITGPLLNVVQMFLQHPGKPLSGADIAKGTKLQSGTLYPLLNRLEVAGWLSSSWEEVSPQEAGRPRRRLYEVTGAGAKSARAALRSVQASSEVLAWT